MTPSLPAWVEKRDGRREAFDADKISQAIFAATEAVGEPNAFLARELADGVLHFLVQENDANVPTTGQIAELVEKVVRELGQPVLAQAFARQFSDQPRKRQAEQEDVTFKFSIKSSPVKVREECLKAYSLNVVYGRDLSAAHQAQLLVIGGLRRPRHLEDIVVDAPSPEPPDSPWSLACSQVRDASHRGGRLVFDSPELTFAVHGPGWLEGVHAAHVAYGRTVHFDVRAAMPPAWANEVTTGPLFGNQDLASAPENTGTLAMLNAAEDNRSFSFLIGWHLRPSDFETPGNRSANEWLLARPKLWPRTTFVFDRPRRPECLAVGIDRSQPAVLLRVGLPLTKFLQLPEVAGDANKMLAKLPSLIGMAVSAGVQKRSYLRQHCPDLSRGFLLDRAVLVVEPCELDETVQTLTGASLLQSKLAMEAAQRILQTLREAAESAGRASGLNVITSLNRLVFLKDAQADMSAQLQLAGNLLKLVPSGALHVVTRSLSADNLWHYLQMSWRTANISRLKLLAGDWSSLEKKTAAQMSART